MGHRLCVYLFAYIFSLLFPILVSSQENIKMDSVNNNLLEDYLTDGQYLTKVTVRSVTECASLCTSEPRCSSYFYNIMLHLCQTHQEIFQSRSGGHEESGWRYFIDSGKCFLDNNQNNDYNCTYAYISIAFHFINSEVLLFIFRKHLTTVLQQVFTIKNNFKSIRRTHS